MVKRLHSLGVDAGSNNEPLRPLMQESFQVHASYGRYHEGPLVVCIGYCMHQECIRVISKMGKKVSVPGVEPLSFRGPILCHSYVHA